ncbi:Protein of unknown function [Propionibacterium freudenreichii]|nr:Protein of unknown function [Propionibacterium freudenreichii]CEI25829.1 Protein of unknown function [Propionibacterium freudenreichii]
MDDVSM